MQPPHLAQADELRQGRARGIVDDLAAVVDGPHRGVLALNEVTRLKLQTNPPHELTTPVSQKLECPEMDFGDSPFSISMLRWWAFFVPDLFGIVPGWSSYKKKAHRIYGKYEHVAPRAPEAPPISMLGRRSVQGSDKGDAREDNIDLWGRGWSGVVDSFFLLDWHFLFRLTYHSPLANGRS